jgi:hypothetical protein
LEATGAGNLPAWASNPLAFWEAADAFERVNGTTYREMEIALPRELLPEQRIDLVKAFVAQELGERHAYQWAIHVPNAADGQEQPQVHLMFSERQRDGIERDPDQYFKRYDAKVPEQGGARKGYGPHAGQTLRASERAADLKALRGRWEQVANQHLERAGVEARIYMRSHAERGTGLEPEAKQLPSQWRGAGREQVIEFRAARVERQQAEEVVRQFAPALAHEMVQLMERREILARQNTVDYQRAKAELLANTPAARLARAQQVITRWDAAVKGEQVAYVADLVKAAIAAGTVHVDRVNAHMDREPRLFGKDKWNKELDTLLYQDRLNRGKVERLKASDPHGFRWYTDLGEAPHVVGEQRAREKYPELVRQLPEAQAYLRQQQAQREQELLQERRREELGRKDDRSRDNNPEPDGPSIKR